MTAAVQGRVRAALGAEVAAVLVALAFFGFGLWQNRFFFHDDAYISLRYAVNLLHHGALDWNPGEPVEGYTNFLHVLLAAGAMALGLGPEAALRAINALSGLALIALMVPAARQVAPGPERAVERALAIVTVGATPGVATWVMGGLEPVMLAALLLAGILGALRIAHEGMRPGALALAAGGFSAAVLTRMDAAVVIAAVGAALLPARGPDGRRMLAAGALVVAIPAAVSLAHMAWRYQTYGMLMPLTFAAKTGLPWAERAALLPAYLRTMVAAAPVVYLGALGVLLGLGRGLRDPAFRIPAFALAAQLAYVVWSGGDHMPGGARAARRSGAGGACAACRAGAAPAPDAPRDAPFRRAGDDGRRAHSAGAADGHGGLHGHGDRAPHRRGLARGQPRRAAHRRFDPVLRQ